jgi:hypothetical protein
MTISKTFITILLVVLVFALLPDQRPNLYSAFVGALILDLIQKTK